MSKKKSGPTFSPQDRELLVAMAAVFAVLGIVVLIVLARRWF
jgi:hypothetical protein